MRIGTAERHDDEWKGLLVIHTRRVENTVDLRTVPHNGTSENHMTRAIVVSVAADHRRHPNTERRVVRPPRR